MLTGFKLATLDRMRVDKNGEIDREIMKEDF